MNGKYLGARTLVAVMTGGCLNRDVASMRQASSTDRASLAPALSALALESQISDAGRLQAAQMPEPAKQPEQQQGGPAPRFEPEFVRSRENVEYDSVQFGA